MNPNLYNDKNDNKEEKDTEDKVIDAVEKFLNTENHITEHKELDVMGYKNKAVLCYIPFVVFYFLVTNQYKKNDYILFHVNQGTIITILWVLVFIITKFTSTQFRVQGLFVSRVPTIVSFFNYILFCIALLYSGFGFVNTINAHSKELPLIGKIKIFK